MIESRFWPHARVLVHLTGLCGAGKTTLAQRLAARCRAHGGVARTTLDWDPLTPDHERADDRAFSRTLDQANLSARGQDPAVHRAILDQALALLARWQASPVNLMVVDRWLESYDDLPDRLATTLFDHLQRSGFTVRHVLLTVTGQDPSGPLDAPATAFAVAHHLLRTKDQRPPAWWASGPATLEQWVDAEVAAQIGYQAWCRRSPFPTLTLDTTARHWDDASDRLVHVLGEPFPANGVAPTGPAGTER